MIEVNGATKQYKDKVAVDDLSFELKPVQVTGFLGPNGSGKSTTLRIIMGLDALDTGSAVVNGCAYGDLPLPLRQVEALWEANAIHLGRSAHNHLVWVGRPRMAVAPHRFETISTIDDPHDKLSSKE